MARVKSLSALDSFLIALILVFMSDEIFKEFGNDPIKLCQDWYDEAEPLEPNDPDAVTLATATPDGKPSLRWVLVKEISDNGFKFHTNAESQKGQELLANPHAAINFYWKSTRKQIRVMGKAEIIDDQETALYFEGRSRGRQIGAWASQQSRPYEKQDDLQNAIEAAEARFDGVEDIPCPDYWKGFRLVPKSIEFWISHKDRLHTRFIFKKSEDGIWQAHYLYP
ncbi:MAG: pyridoxamine 5'-phosphate oxidase [Pseudomonadota bacterium]